MTKPYDYDTTHAAGSIRGSIGLIPKKNEKVSAKEVAADKIAAYFASLQPYNGMRGGISVEDRATEGFAKTDLQEAGVNKGDKKLTAKTWNGIMKKLGISGFRIKSSISNEEFEAFLKKYGI